MITNDQVTGFEFVTSEEENLGTVVSERTITIQDGKEVDLILTPTAPEGKSTILRQLKFTMEDVNKVQYSLLLRDGTDVESPETPVSLIDQITFEISLNNVTIIMVIDTKPMCIKRNLFINHYLISCMRH